MDLDRIEAKRMEGLLAMSYVLGDETPTKLKVQTRAEKKELRHPALSTQAELYRKITAGRMDEPEFAKVFQMEYHIVLAIRGTGPDNEWVCLHAELPTPLVSMDRVTAETIHEVKYNKQQAFTNLGP